MYDELIKAAKEAMTKAYAPYSRFIVGAAILCESGKIYSGCNIENVAHTGTICAERTAIAKAVSEGDRSFAAIAVCGGHDGIIDEVCTPCGVCRQVLAEFCRDDLKVILIRADGYNESTLGELLPYAFHPSGLDKN